MPADSNRHAWKLTASAVLAVGVGAVFLVRYLAGDRGTELLEFTTLYIVAPLAVSLVLLFSYLQRR